MAYALDDGRSVVISTHPVTMREGIAEIDSVAYSEDLTYSQLDVMCGGTRPKMTIGVCYPIHVAVGEFAAVDLRGVPAINSGQMAPLSADFGVGVCDGN